MRGRGESSLEISPFTFELSEWAFCALGFEATVGATGQGKLSVGCQTIQQFPKGVVFLNSIWLGSFQCPMLQVLPAPSASSQAENKGTW